MTTDRALDLRWFVRNARRIVDRRFVWQFAGITVASLLISTLDAVGILLLVPLIDILSSGGATTSLEIPVLGEMSAGALIALIVGFFIAKILCASVIRWWSTGMVQHSAGRTATELFRAYIQAPMAYHDRRNSAESVRSTTVTVEQLYDRGFMATVTIVTEGSTLLILAAVLLIASPGVAFIGVVYFLVASLLFLRVVQPRVQRLGRATQSVQTEVIQTVQEGLGGLREHRVRSSEPNLVTTFSDQRQRLASQRHVLAFIRELPRSYLELIFLSGFGLIAASVLALQGAGSALAVFAVVLGVGFRILPSISRLLAAFPALRQGAAALEVIVTDLDQIGITSLKRSPLSISAPGASARPKPSRLTVEEVSFRYTGSTATALDAVTFDLPAGASIGIVGPSGAGKSTLIDLICGLRDPGQGEILVDGKPLSDALAAWRSAIGYVPQDVYLLDATVARNVAFGLPEDADAVRLALQSAQLLDFVETLDHGIDTIIGERGTRLSGGQQQRIGIARALYGQPSVLVLDEATAALDMETEAAVVDSVDVLSGQISLIVVAHRLSTIRRCDSVVYLDQGRIKGAGTFAEVAAQVPEFRRAVELAGLNHSLLSEPTPAEVSP